MGRVQSIFVALLIVASVAGVGISAAERGQTTAPLDQHEAGDGSTGTAQENATETPFALRTGNVEICGLTCRQVTVTLSNTANETAENVTIESEVTTGGERIVHREAYVDSLAPNESITRTVEVNVGLNTLNEIRQAGGKITVTTQVTSDQYNVTFVGQRQVV